MRALIIFASHDGQTQRIADRIARRMNQAHIPTDLHNVTEHGADRISVDAYEAVVFGSPLHYGEHDARIRSCIAKYHDVLTRVPTGFLSVSLGIASVHPDDRREAIRLAERFVASLNWKPSVVAHFAGALRYSRYGWLKKRMMRYIAEHSGAKTRTDQDYEYTDWNDVDEFADDVIREIVSSSPQPGMSKSTNGSC